jgi:hypothetical protein
MQAALGFRAKEIQRGFSRYKGMQALSQNVSQFSLDSNTVMVLFTA